MAGGKVELQRRIDGLVARDRKSQKEENRVALMGVMAGIPGAQLEKDLHLFTECEQEEEER